jgi:hypothetical protein
MVIKAGGVDDNPKKKYGRLMEQNSLDSTSLVMIVILGLFLASMMGLFSKDKTLRKGALIVGFSIAIGGTLLALLGL